MDDTPNMHRQPGRTSRWPFLAPLLLALLVFALYVPSIRLGFVYDDEALIVRQATPERLADFASVVREPHRPGLPHYRPVARLTLLLQQYVHGRDPEPFHVFSTCLASAAALLAFALMRLPVFRIGRGPALFAALLFAVHPVASSCVYSVSSGQEALIASCWMMAAVYAYLRTGRAWRVAAYLAFAAALFSREQAIAVPVLFILVDALKLTDRQPARGPAARLRHYLPVLPIVAVYAAMRVHLFAASGLAAALAPHLGRDALSYLYALQAIVAPFTHLQYEPPLAVWLDPLRAASALAVAAVLAFAVSRHWTRARPAVVFWAVWFLVVQLPAVNVLAGEAVFAERHVFPASLGLLAVAACALPRAWQSVHAGRLAVAAAVLLATCWAGISLWRGDAFKNEYAFALQWVRSNPRSVAARGRLGDELMSAQRHTDAAVQYEKALALDPTDDPANGDSEAARAAADGRLAIPR